MPISSITDVLSMGILKECILFIFAFASGAGVAGGLFALITVLGVIVRFAIKTGTEQYIGVYESCIIFGAALSNIVWVYHISLRLGEVMCFIAGLTYGMFVGAMAMALSETIKVFPIMIRRLKLKIGITAMVTGFALGKAVGGIICYVYYIR